MPDSGLDGPKKLPRGCRTGDSPVAGQEFGVDGGRDKQDNE